jgi:acyl carrier protein
MDQTKYRLAMCFRIVFPELTELEIFDASHASVAAWDSIASITLVNVIEEEFKFDVEFEVLAELTSFDRILEYLNQQSASCGQAKNSLHSAS